MTDAEKTPTPAELAAAASGAQQGMDPEVVARMQQPIDVKGTYRIEGRAVLEIYTIIDEIPMKYARVLLPALQGSLEPVKE